MSTHWVRGLAALVAVAMVTVACAASATPAPSDQIQKPIAAVPPPQNVAPVGAPPPASDAASRRDALIAARAEVQRAMAGTDRDDLTSLLQTADNVADEGQAYQAYLGVWQYMRLIFTTNGQRADHRAVLDRLEAVAKTYPQFRPEHFEVQKR